MLVIISIKKQLILGSLLLKFQEEMLRVRLFKFSMENSNVDIIKEMMEMIMTQKGLELLGKAMQAGEAMLKAGMGMT